MNTEKAIKLLSHFKEQGVSHNPDNGGLQHVLDYQDVIGQSTKREIMGFEESLAKGDEKKNFVWVNFLTLDQDMAINIIKDTVVHRFIQKDIEAVDDEYQEKFQECDRQSSQLSDAKKHIYKRIRKLEDEKKRLAGRVEYFKRIWEGTRNTNWQLRQKLAENQEKAQKYDTIKSLLT